MKKNTLFIFILTFMSIMIFYPLIMLIINVDLSSFKELLKSIQFKTAIYNSLIVTSISTFFSILLAFLLAYAINMTNIKRKSLLTTLFTLPMLIPSISHGLGLINLFGINGLILKGNIFGFKGIVLGSVLYSFPVAFLILNDAFKYIDNSLYENARVLGFNKVQIFKKVTLPYMWIPLISAIFATFTLIFTDYGVPLSIGGNYITLPVYLYKQVIGLLDFSKGTLIGVFLLMPALISFIFDLFVKKYTNDANAKEYIVPINKKRDLIYNILSYSIIIFIFIIMISFVYIAFTYNYPHDLSFSLKHFVYLIKNDNFKYLVNSIIITLFCASIGTIITYFAAYITGRSKYKFKKIIHVLSIIPIAVPGIVLGLSYVIAFNKTPIYNTYLIIIVVNIIHFFSTPYLMAYNVLNKVDFTYEDLAKTCGISKFKLITKVLIPITKVTIVEMFSYFFVNSMITISAVTFLYSTDTMPFSLLINQYESGLMLEEAAIVSIIIFSINFTIKSMVYLYKRFKKRKEMLYEAESI